MAIETQQPILVDLNFASEKTAPNAFEFPLITHIKTGGPLWLSPTKVPMHNLRQMERRPTVEEERFSWETVPYDGLDGDEGWEEKYSAFMCEWLKDYLGAREVRCTNAQVRRRDERADPNNNWKKDVPIKNDMQPVPAVHVDVTRDRGQQQTLLAYEGSGYTEKDRIARFNIWRPLHGPVMDMPLALCDSRTVDWDDLERTSDRFGTGYFVKHNEKMKWMYVRDMGPDDIYVFLQYDSSLSPSENDIKSVAHTAFTDEARKYLGKPRESIELRMAVVY